MRRLLTGLCAATVLAAAEITFAPLPRPQIEARFQRLPQKNAGRAQAVREMFAEVSCKGEHYQEQPVKGSKLPNLICTLPGASPDTILVTAHYDKVDAHGSQGAVDNWTSASLLSSMYQALSTVPRRYTLTFIAFTDEEKGLVGSRFYAASLSLENLQHIQAVVNMDSIGMIPTEIWVSRADPELVDDAALVARSLNLPVSAMNVDRYGDSDSHPFKNRKLRVIDFHSVTAANIRVLHSAKDKPSAIDWNAYYDTYRLVAGFLAYLDPVAQSAPTASH